MALTVNWVNGPQFLTSIRVDEYSMLCYIFELEEFKDRTHTGWQVQQSRLHVY